MEMYPRYTFALGQSEARISCQVQKSATFVCTNSVTVRTFDTKSTQSVVNVIGIKHSESGDVLCRHIVTHGAYFRGAIVFL